MCIFKNCSKYIRYRVVPLPSLKAKIRNYMLIKQGSRFAPRKFFLKPPKASQKCEWMPWRVEVPNKSNVSETLQKRFPNALDRQVGLNNFLNQCINDTIMFINPYLVSGTWHRLYHLEPRDEEGGCCKPFTHQLERSCVPITHSTPARLVSSHLVRFPCTSLPLLLPVPPERIRSFSQSESYKTITVPFLSHLGWVVEV